MFYGKTVLDNGVTVLTEKMPGVRSVTIGFWFKVGSRDEEPAQAGLSHFMEHMMFKGTPSRDAYAISSAFDALGAELNAFTSREYTCYYCRVVDQKAQIAFSMLSDMVVNSLYPQDQIELEREVVIEEIARGNDNPEDFIWDLHTAAMFPNSPIGRPIAGTRDIVAGFNHDDCISYHDKFYCGENLVVAIAGNIEHDDAVRMAQAGLGDLAEGFSSERVPTSSERPLPVAFEQRQTEQAHLLLGFPSYCLGHPLRYALALSEMALGGGMSSRLFQEVREKRGLAYAVFTQNISHTDCGEICIYVGTRPDNLEKVIELVRLEVCRMRDGNLSAEELERVRDYATGQIMLSLESTRSHMTRLGRPAITGQPIQAVDDVLQRYRAVTLDDTAQAVSEVLSREGSIAVISPHGQDEVKAFTCASA